MVRCGRMIRFTELNPEWYRGAILIVDIDGTVTNDRSHQVDGDAKDQLKALSQVARVYLCSNSTSTARFWQLAKETGTVYIGTQLRKPDPAILRLIPETTGKRIVVVGDKQLTDGRFAAKIGAEFVRVERVTHSSDRHSVKLTYLLDDVFSWASKKFIPAHSYIRLARPLQWVKNTLVFAPIFFANQAFNLSILGQGIAAFFAFSLVASAVYVMNDIVDAAQDRQHPRKRLRPIARGLVSETKAIALIGAIIAVASIVLTFVPHMLPIVFIYGVLNMLYSFKLKHVAVVDVVLVALFYLLRVVAGGVATSLYLSPWIILCVFFGALFIVVGKRRAEANRDSRRTVLHAYSREALDAMLIVSSGLAVISYSLYSIMGHNSPYLVFSSIFVAFALLRVLNDIYVRPEEAEAPERLVFMDPWILVSFVAWIVYVFWVFYFTDVL
jgi:decaprenyl-phosphate phosphoribosyltransferase